jgi:integrase
MTTISAILDRFERDYVPTLAPRTQIDYTRHVAKLRAVFGDRDPDEMRPRDFAEFLNVKKGPIQRVRQLAVLASALAQAVSVWYMCERNVLRDVKRRKNPPRDRLVLDREFDGVLALAPVRMKLAMRLALLTGQRQGDLLRFKWTDVRDMELHLTQQKTGKRLAIAINSELESVLDQCWKMRRCSGDTILQTRSGRPYTSEGFRAVWQRVQQKWAQRGGERFHFHDIRALAATKCASPEIAMRLLGHTTLAMTLRVYRRGIERVQALDLSAVTTAPAVFSALRPIT